MGELISTLAAILQTYFVWQQNQIFKQQNAIFEYQAGIGKLKMSEQPSKSVLVRRYWPMPLIALMMVITWAAVGFGYYKRVFNPVPIVEFDEPQEGPILNGYGNNPPDSCWGQIDGKADVLSARRAEYKVAIGCFIYDGKEDILDAPELQVSRLYDIKTDLFEARASYSREFNEYAAHSGAFGVKVALLLVPNGVDISQVSTLRQARSLKVHILVVATTTGSPPQLPRALGGIQQ